MGHYRSALSNWLRGRRRQREPSDNKSDASTSQAPPPPAPTACGYESDSSRAPTWVSNGASELEASGLGSARGRRSVSDSAVLEATQSNLRHMRSFEAVGAASHISGRRLAQLPHVDTAPQSTGKHRRSTWASWQEGVSRATSTSVDAAAAPTPIYLHQQHHEHHHSLRRFHLSRRISRRLSRQHTHHDVAAGGAHSPEAVALTPAPSIIFIEC